MLASVSVGLIVTLLMGSWPTRRPSVVVIVVDTLRADAVSTQLGNAKTPHIAALAAEGLSFSQAFAHAPMTLPAHAAIFSGKHPFETKVLNNGQAVPPDLPLLAEQLEEEGFATSAVLSLATLWPEFTSSGLDRGFASYSLGEFEVSPAQHTTPRLDAALDALNPNDPFFLFAHFADPHEPYNDGGACGRHAEVQLDGERIALLSTSEMSYWDFELELGPGKHELQFVSEDDFRLRKLSITENGSVQELDYTSGALFEAGRRTSVRLPNVGDTTRSLHVRAWLNDVPTLSESRARYRTEVTRSDAAIGTLLEGLKQRGLYENTLIILTSDHGEALGEHGMVGHVDSLYDELLHVPLVVRLPRGRLDLRMAASRESLVRHVDLAGTIFAELGLTDRAEEAGRSLFDSEARTLLSETHPPEAMRSLFCARDETYKLIYAPEDESFEMYRLGPDPLELDNVFAHQGHLRETWQKVLLKLATDSQPNATRDAAVQSKLSALGY